MGSPGQPLLCSRAPRPARSQARGGGVVAGGRPQRRQGEADTRPEKPAGAGACGGATRAHAGGGRDGGVMQGRWRGGVPAAAAPGSKRKRVGEHEWVAGMLTVLSD